MTTQFWRWTISHLSVRIAPLHHTETASFFAACIARVEPVGQSIWCERAAVAFRISGYE